MNTPLYLTRARLRAAHGEALASIAPILLPNDPDTAVAHAHRLVWILFQQTSSTLRDDTAESWRARGSGNGFLWRDEGNGRFLVLSRQPPVDPHGLFDLDSKPFEPSLARGDRLRIALRANPTKAKPAERGADGKCRSRGKRVDVVMDALHKISRTNWNTRSGRAFERDGLVQQATVAWLARQGRTAGFEIAEAKMEDDLWRFDEDPAAPKPMISATNYTQLAIERHGSKGHRPAGVSTVDISGEIRVVDPDVFLARLPLGFGSAKAFGCGLMLIRRAH
jgi:CRISPR system Cascade subunit CasE